jgi:hypothetical protein
MPRPGIETGPSTLRGEHSRKKPFEQLVNSYSEHLHMRPGQDIFYIYITGTGMYVKKNTFCIKKTLKQILYDLRMHYNRLGKIHRNTTIWR